MHAVKYIIMNLEMQKKLTGWGLCYFSFTSSQISFVSVDHFFETIINWDSREFRRYESYKKIAVYACDDILSPKSICYE